MKEDQHSGVQSPFKVEFQFFGSFNFLTRYFKFYHSLLVKLVTKNCGGLTNKFFKNPPIRAKKLKFRLIKTLDQLCKSKGVTRKTGKSGLAD